MLNLMDKRYITVFKIIGVFAIVVGALIYGEMKFYQGMQKQCYLDGGFLMQNGKGEPSCEKKEVLEERGWVVVDEKTLSPLIKDDNNLDGYDWEWIPETTK